MIEAARHQSPQSERSKAADSVVENPKLANKQDQSPLSSSACPKKLERLALNCHTRRSCREQLFARTKTEPFRAVRQLERSPDPEQQAESLRKKQRTCGFRWACHQHAPTCPKRQRYRGGKHESQPILISGEQCCQSLSHTPWSDESNFYHSVRWRILTAETPVPTQNETFSAT